VAIPVIPQFAITPIMFCGIPENTNNKVAISGHKSITPEMWQSTPKNNNNRGYSITDDL
jgi:hypothetical protein